MNIALQSLVIMLKNPVVQKEELIQSLDVLYGYLQNNKVKENICDVILFLFEKYDLQDDEISYRICRLIPILTIDLDVHRMNRLRLSPSCKYLVRLLENKEDSKLLITVLESVWYLSREEVNQDEFGRLGACALVLNVLKQHPCRSHELAHAGLAATGNLAFHHDANRAELGKQNACQIIVDIVSKYGALSPDLAQSGCATICNLASNEQNQNQLAKIGACELVINLLEMYGTTSEMVARNGCWAVKNLSKRNQITQQLFQQSGASKTIIKVISEYGLTSEGVARNACCAIRNLAEKHSQNQMEFIKEGLIDKLLPISRVSDNLRDLVCDTFVELSFSRENVFPMFKSIPIDMVIRVIHELREANETRNLLTTKMLIHLVRVQKSNWLQVIRTLCSIHECPRLSRKCALRRFPPHLMRVIAEALPIDGSDY